jgi:hypothetical protein
MVLQTKEAKKCLLWLSFFGLSQPVGVSPPTSVKTRGLCHHRKELTPQYGFIPIKMPSIKGTGQIW